MKNLNPYLALLLMMPMGAAGQQLQYTFANGLRPLMHGIGFANGVEYPRRQNETAVVKPIDIAVVGLGIGVFFAPEIFGIQIDELPDCGPCDPATLPFFDRFAVGESREVFADGSDYLRAGIMALSSLDLLLDSRQGQSAVVTAFESWLWADGIVRIAKRVVGRKRPILYTTGDPAVMADPFNQRSWPSGHAAISGAVAASYWLAQNDIGRPKTDVRRWLVVGGALGVGVLRVAAHKHFPSDVVSGFAVGVIAAFAVHEVRF